MEIYVVGGWVRDTLMMKKPVDMDFVVTGATPEDLIEFGKSHKLTFKKVGADFPVYLDQHKREWALARKERKSGNGYKGFVCEFDPSVTIEEDLFRRDLTINAIASKVVAGSNGMLPSKELVDPYGGQEDISNKTLRHVSEHFKEDPVRVLRLARFMARFGPEFKVADETQAMVLEMCQKTNELQNLVPERIWAETEKALHEAHPYLFFKTLMETPACHIVYSSLPFKINEELFTSIEKAVLTKEKVALLFSRIRNNYDILHFQKFIPAKIMNFAFKYNRMVRRITLENYKKSPEFVCKMFKEFSVFKNEDLLKDMVLTAVNDDKKLFDSITCLYNIFVSIQKISYNNLTIEEQKSLVGPEIGAAIWNLRKEVIFNRFTE